MSKHEAQHFAGTRERVAGWSRRRKAAAGAGVLAAFVTGAVVAWALLVATGEFTGGGKITAPTDVVFAGASVPATGQHDVDCTVTLAGDNKSLDLQMANGLAGGNCVVNMSLWRIGQDPGEPIYITGVDFADVVTEQFVASPGSTPCNPADPVEVPEMDSVPEPAVVAVKFTLGGTNGSFTANASAGLAVTTELPDGSCPTAS